jgi:hypothetical protein
VGTQAVGDPRIVDDQASARFEQHFSIDGGISFELNVVGEDTRP